MNNIQKTYCSTTYFLNLVFYNEHISYLSEYKSIAFFLIASWDWYAIIYVKIFSTIFLFFFSFPFLNWRIIALQYCVGFCHTSALVSCRYTCVSSLLNLPPTLNFLSSFFFFFYYYAEHCSVYLYTQSPLHMCAKCLLVRYNPRNKINWSKVYEYLLN